MFHYKVVLQNILFDKVSIFTLKAYHPARVLTLVYQPFALGTMALLAYNESKLDTRKRNIAGYIIFFLSTLALVVVSTASSQICIISSFLDEHVNDFFRMNHSDTNIF